MLLFPNIPASHYYHVTVSCHDSAVCLCNKSKLSLDIALQKLHDEAVARRKLVFSVTEDLGKLKGTPPSRADVELVRGLEVELAEQYAELVDGCQTTLTAETEAWKSSRMGVEDASSALTAVESLTGRAATLLTGGQGGDSEGNTASPTFDWQQMCFSDFLSIELTTVK